MKRIKANDYLLLLALLVTGSIYSQGPQKNTEIITDPAAIQKLKSEVEANPGDLKKHQEYIKAVGLESPELEKQYDAWIKQFPAMAIVPFAIGDAYCNKESPKARPYLLKAVAIDPKFAKAYSDLWIDGERWGDFNASRAYLAKAVEADPANADYNFYYANSFSKIDEAKYKRLSLAVAKNFPATERGAQSLYWLANRSNDPKEKIAYYEQARTDFPADKFSWTSSSMSEYFDLLLETDPAKAASLAQSMQETMTKDNQKKQWASQVALAQNVMQARSLITENKMNEANAILAKINVGRYSSAKAAILLMRAEAADKSGNTQAAYDSLLASYAKEPTEKIGNAVKKYGKKLNKDEATVNADVLKIREDGAKTAQPFTFEQYMKPGSASLSDYRGKVVLITYWFPGCGPCRGEFPHFENVIRKYKGKDVAYLGLNIALDQDDYVVPFMKSSGYSFTPLRVDPKWEKGNLDNRNAAPMNFLIDKEGRIVFANFRTNESNERTLELMINSLLTGKAI